ncbi:MAG: glutamate decarboxylase [Acidimicrobiales bacterium]
MPLHTHETGAHRDQPLALRPQFERPGEPFEVPRFRLAPGGMPAGTAYQVVHDELLLDGSARLNLATFVTTWMERDAEALMAESAAKNMIDKDEYPQTAEIERRCVNILAHLWNASPAEQATGCSTTGSSEACMLGGLALKWRWRARRTSAGLPADRPNLVMGANVQVCWEKFCRYWDVEPRLVPVGPTSTCLTAEGAAAHCDENTIGVVAVLGSTYDGEYEPVAAIAAALDVLAAERGADVPIHVDGASGGFIAPFLDPGLLWDFRLERVASINASGHKFGLVYPGVGWVVWRDAAALPDDLVFDVDYLGGHMPTFALNFSRPGAQVVAQYYNFIRLGHDGYRRVQQQCRDIAGHLADRIAAIGPFSLVSRGDGIPAVAFSMTASGTASHDDYSVFDVSEALRSRGWLVPAYTMPPALDGIAVLRVVVRNGFSHDMAEMFLADLVAVVERLSGSTRAPAAPTGFHH